MRLQRSQAFQLLEEGGSKSKETGKQKAERSKEPDRRLRTFKNSNFGDTSVRNLFYKQFRRSVIWMQSKIKSLEPRRPLRKLVFRSSIVPGMVYACTRYRIYAQGGNLHTPCFATQQQQQRQTATTTAAQQATATAAAQQEHGCQGGDQRLRQDRAVPVPFLMGHVRRR